MHEGVVGGFRQGTAYNGTQLWNPESNIGALIIRTGNLGVAQLTVTSRPDVLSGPRDTYLRELKINLLDYIGFRVSGGLCRDYGNSQKRLKATYSITRIRRILLLGRTSLPQSPEPHLELPKPTFFW